MSEYDEFCPECGGLGTQWYDDADWSAAKKVCLSCSGTGKAKMSVQKKRSAKAAEDFGSYDFNWRSDIEEGW